ncbi:MAG: macro domain-containing protein [Pseudomonadota bacterium]
MNRVLSERVLDDGRRVISLWGDITAETVDAVVNAADTRLRHGGGVAGAISRAGGPAIQAESDAIAPVPTGGAKATGGGDLPARYVIHAVGPIWRGGDGGEEVLLASAVRSTLDVAAAMDLASVSLPAISAGIYGFPLDRAVAIIHGSVMAWLDTHPAASLREIRFCNINLDVAQRFAALLTSARTSPSSLAEA